VLRKTNINPSVAADPRAVMVVPTLVLVGALMLADERLVWIAAGLSAGYALSGST
jgi:hypothetical protein